MSDERTIVLTGQQIVEIVTEYAAKQAGLPLPATRVGRWRMVDGQIQLELRFEVASNVRKLETVRLGKRRG